MSDAPETIWAMEYFENYDGRRFIDTCTKITGSYKQPYIRADLHAAVVAENEGLLSVNQELQALANKAQSIAADQIDKTNKAQAERDELRAALEKYAQWMLACPPVPQELIDALAKVRP